MSFHRALSLKLFQQGTIVPSECRQRAAVKARSEPLPASPQLLTMRWRSHPQSRVAQVINELTHDNLNIADFQETQTNKIKFWRTIVTADDWMNGIPGQSLPDITEKLYFTRSSNKHFIESLDHPAKRKADAIELTGIELNDSPIAGGGNG
jgi:hypothetical protein